MYKYYKLGCFCFIAAIFSYSCQPTKTVFYSYKVDNYVADISKTMLRTGRLISCGDYLIEFKMKINMKSETEMYDTGSRLVSASINYDTIGVYLLANRQYFEFDTFATSGIMLKKGPIADKQFGFKFGEGKNTADLTQPYLSLPKDTLINNIFCYYVDVLGTKEYPVSDTMGTQFLLIKNRQLASLYKAYGLTCMNNDYSIVGIHQYHKQKKEGFWEEPADLRPVTAAERAICESLIQKAGLPPPK